LLDGDHERYRRASLPGFRSRLAASRAFLKSVAGTALGLPAGSLRLMRDRHGRPYLAGLSGVDVNLSHTADVLVVGLSVIGRIGVDVEHRDRNVHSTAFVARACHDAEASSMGELPAALRDEQLIWLWTLKEAFAKARGDGLSLDFTTVRTQCRAGGPVFSVDGTPAFGWRFTSTVVARRYRIATALGPPTRVPRTTPDREWRDAADRCWIDRRAGGLRERSGRAGPAARPRTGNDRRAMPEDPRLREPDR
jgi:4'-phosphopantetheinyl transferase